MIYHYHRREALSIWKSRLGSAATYKALIEVFMKAGRRDYAEIVCSLLKDIGTSGKLTRRNLASHEQLFQVSSC